ncbi:polyphosphate kinase 2 family protein [Marinibaculum pumilum]|uniref:Polyphosphate kinase 2 family protein n=1 Tax=Marinibaculum pumilum TaxID=1766165 RepID=A0ABV7L264_9PROT
MSNGDVADHLKAACRIGRLAAVDLTARMADSEEYEKAIKELQKRLLTVQQAYLVRGYRAVVAFEGWDAAGKGGAVRRLTSMLDPRFLKVWPIGAPNILEQEMPFLHRFWMRLPSPGTLTIFDRSWYGRVLVERVEGLIPPAAWERAYDEINAFEATLQAEDVRVVKILLHVSAEEQLQRLAERLSKPRKRWKLTEADFLARQYRGAYIDAYEEMLDRCSPPERPWLVLSGEYKWFGRVASLQAICEALEKDVDLTPPPLDDRLRALAAAAGIAGDSIPDDSE